MYIVNLSANINYLGIQVFLIVDWLLFFDNLNQIITAQDTPKILDQISDSNLPIIQLFIN